MVDFVKKNWQFRDIISENELNRIENGIEEGITKAEQADQKAQQAQQTANQTASDLAAHLADNAPNPRGNQIYHVEVVSSSVPETPDAGRIIFDTSQGKFFGGNGTEWV